MEILTRENLVVTRAAPTPASKTFRPLGKENYLVGFLTKAYLLPPSKR